MILVTGATGNNGAELVGQLSAMGVPVRAMVRRPRGEGTVAPASVEFVTADFDQPESLRHALAGIESAFLVTNSSEHAEAQQLRFIELARESGVRHVVYLSQLHAAADSPVRFLRYHAVVEEALRVSGMRFTNLRPNLYMQALLSVRQLVVRRGLLAAPIGDARVSVVDVRDLAAVAAATLTGTGHDGQTYDLTGPESLTHAEMAAQLAETLGRPVQFADIPAQAMRQALLGADFPEWQADGLIEDYAHYHRGEAAVVSSAIRDTTGQAPRTFATFARDHREAFLDV